MLHDLFLVELYFGPHEAAHKVEDLTKHYGRSALEAAHKRGLIKLFSPISSRRCGRHSSQVLCWLSEKGRSLAAKNSHI